MLKNKKKKRKKNGLSSSTQLPDLEIIDEYNIHTSVTTFKGLSFIEV